MQEILIKLCEFLQSPKGHDEACCSEPNSVPHYDNSLLVTSHYSPPHQVDGLDHQYRLPLLREVHPARTLAGADVTPQMADVWGPILKGRQSHNYQVDCHSSVGMWDYG